jgi:hypothetical protein
VTVTDGASPGTELVSIDTATTPNGTTPATITGTSMAFSFTRFHGLIATHTNRVVEEPGNDIFDGTFLQALCKR